MALPQVRGDSRCSRIHIFCGRWFGAPSFFLLVAPAGRGGASHPRLVLSWIRYSVERKPCEVGTLHIATINTIGIIT